MIRKSWRMVGLLLGAMTLFIASTGLADHRPGNTVLVGGAISQTGRYAEPATRQYNSVKMWVDQVNQRGGLLGHKVELVMLDDKSETQTAIKLY